MTLTLAKLAEIEAAAAKATPGQRAVVDGHYPAFKELDGLSFKVSVVMFATDLTEKDYQARNADLSFLAFCDPATIAALCRDARRYHYLRNRDNAFVLSTDGPEAGVWCDCESVSGELQLLTERDLDGAIDAALAKDKP